MDPLDAIPPIQSGPPTPAPTARVARVERDQRHADPGQERPTRRHADEEAEEDDQEDFYDEGWNQRFNATATPEDDQGSGPHIDIIA